MEGIIIKAYGGFYYVQSNHDTVVCKIRGKIALKQSNVLVGDRVRVQLTKPGEGVIESILSRTSKLVRPPIANVNQTVVVFAWRSPEPNAMLLDRFLIQSQFAQIPPVICFNKTDLAQTADLELARHYQPTGYPVLTVSAYTEQGLSELKEHLKGRVTVLAGPSGVGKSSLLNAIKPTLQLKTGEISRKLKRGKHTTRHVELIPLADGGLVADTPGFSQMGLPPLRREQLADYYPEFALFEGGCKFSGCLHHQEPGCAVKTAVEQGHLSWLRHEQYVTLLTEVIAAERRY